MIYAKMPVQFYILDCESHYHEVTLRQKAFAISTLNSENGIIRTFQRPNSTTIVLDVHPIRLWYLLKELQYWHCLRKRVIRLLRHSNTTVLLKVLTINEGVLDKAWCRRANALTWQKVEEEDLMSWLSTLGGAFSALGDNFEKCVSQQALFGIGDKN